MGDKNSTVGFGGSLMTLEILEREFDKHMTGKPSLFDVYKTKTLSEEKEMRLVHSIYADFDENGRYINF